MQNVENYQLVFVKSNHQVSSPEQGESYHFANPVVAKKKKRILAELVEAEIPISYYTFSPVNNFLSITLEGDNATETVSASIHERVFTVSDFIPYLNGLFDNLATNFTLTFAYQASLLKLNLTVASAGSNSQVNKIKINNTTTCGSYTGLLPNQEHSGSNASLSIFAQNAINLNRTLNVYVKTNLKTENIDSRGLNDGTIAKIGVDKAHGEILHYHNIENIKFLINDTYIDHLDIKLEDDDGQLLDFNGVQYHITFAFKYVDEVIERYVPTLYDKVSDLQRKVDT